MNKKLIVLLMFTLTFSACKPLDETLLDVIENVNHLFNPNSPLKHTSVKPSGTPFSDLPPLDAQSTTSELAKANSEILSEMMRVIFNETEEDNKVGFGELAHSLNSGASLEGVYRGIIMNSRYRALESNSQAASPTVLKAFANELAGIQVDMRDPTEFSPETAKHAPAIEFPDGSSAEATQNAKVLKDAADKQSKANLVEQLLETFIGASPYTLKRVLADETLKKMDELKDSPGELAQWYAKTVVRLCDTHIDFGLKQRNTPDYDFHFKFAQKMALDRVKWEMLNRDHRYLNYFMDLK
jgi:hypothetical protein